MKKRVRHLPRQIEKEGEAPSKTKIAKLLLLADLAYYKERGKSLLESTYTRMAFGPCPMSLEEILDEGIEEGLWKTEARPFLHDSEREVYVVYIPINPMPELEEDAVTLLKNTIKEHGYKKAIDLSKLSHDIPAWKQARDGDILLLEELAITDPDEYELTLKIVDEMADPTSEKTRRALDDLLEGRADLRVKGGDGSA
ncbi:MAG: type II toxin-antitoxin system antitoxin SocA domain-containing protein [candidate division WOR-3 bacterium]